MALTKFAVSLGLAGLNFAYPKADQEMVTKKLPLELNVDADSRQ